MLKCLNVNKQAIDLKKSKQLLYRLIYNLRPSELETVKTFIKTNLINCFITLFKSSIRSPILFVKKLNR